MKKKFTRSSVLPHAASFVVPQYQFHDRIANSCFVVSFVLICLCFLLVWFNISQLPPQIPLFFQLPWGEKQLAVKGLAWLQPGLLLIFFLINYALSIFTSKNEPLIARILGGTVIVCSIMSIISLWNIINLVVAVKYWF